MNIYNDLIKVYRYIPEQQVFQDTDNEEMVLNLSYIECIQDDDENIVNEGKFISTYETPCNSKYILVHEITLGMPMLIYIKDLSKLSTECEIIEESLIIRGCVKTGVLTPDVASRINKHMVRYYNTMK